ncbi:MAG TPA: hypothetical protein VIJ85_05765 [Rhizomicrobium sp.]
MRHTELAAIAGAVLLASTALAGAQIAPIAATPAPNTVAASASAPPVAGSSDYKTAMICRSMPAQTGSLLGGRRVCLTQYDWDKQRLQAEKNLQDSQLRDRSTSY